MYCASSVTGSNIPGRRRNKTDVVSFMPSHRLGRILQDVRPRIFNYSQDTLGDTLTIPSGMSLIAGSQRPKKRIEKSFRKACNVTRYIVVCSSRSTQEPRHSWQVSDSVTRSSTMLKCGTSQVMQWVRTIRSLLARDKGHSGIASSQALPMSAHSRGHYLEWSVHAPSSAQSSAV